MECSFKNVSSCLNRSRGLWKKLIGLSMALFLASIASAELVGKDSENNPDLKSIETLGIEAPFSNEAFLNELESFFTTIETNYGPLTFKEEHFGFSWNDLKQSYRSKLTNSKSTADVYRIYAELLSSLRDAHVSFSLPSNYTATLPLQFTIAEDKSILNFMSAKFDQREICQFEIGDELVSFDGMSPDELRQVLRQFLNTGNDLTDRTLLTHAFTRRKESSGLSISNLAKTPAKIVLRSHSTGALKPECEIPWKTSGIPLISRPVSLQGDETQALSGFSIPQLIFGHLQTSMSSRIQHWASDLMNLQNNLIRLEAPIATANLNFENGEDLSNEEKDKEAKSYGTEIKVGHAKPHFPLPGSFIEYKGPSILGPIFQMSGFYAGMFRHGRTRVGILRIPSYMPPNIFVSFFGLRYFIAKLERESDVLIIDQNNNPGGAVVLADWVTMSLVKNASARDHIKFKVKPTQAFMRQFATIISTIEQQIEATEDPTQKEALKRMAAKHMPNMRENLETIKTAYMKNADLSEPISLFHMTSFVTEAIDLLNGEMFKDQPQLKKVAETISRWLTGVDLTKPQFYTKKVYMLINELDFSGGDYTPAVLKDYERVTLVGKNTAGAGGAVDRHSNKVLNAFDYSLTNSLMIRKNGKLVENFGVKPHIEFGVKIEDYQNGFENYLPRLIEKLEISDGRQN